MLLEGGLTDVTQSEIRRVLNESELPEGVLVDRFGRYRAETMPQTLDQSWVFRLQALEIVGALEDTESCEYSVATGVQRRRLYPTPILDAEKEHRLAVAVTHYDPAAREEMLISNTRLVRSLVGRIHFEAAALDEDDLFQEGFIGLMRAVEKFDPDRGLKLSTYATWWVRQAIDRGRANYERTVRLPVHIIERIRALERARRSLD